MDEDIKLLEEFKLGDERAFEKLVTKNKESVFKIIYSVIGNAREADDIAQEVFLKVYSFAGSFKGNSSFSTWLYRITANKCYDAIKKWKSNSVSLESELDDNEFSKIQDLLKSNEESIKDKMLGEEIHELIKNALKELPKKHSMVLTLIDINDFSYNEAAEIMDISIDKLKVWLFRARKKLREILYPIYKSYSEGGAKQ